MISIIIPLYNKEKSIGRCIDSVLSQTYKDFECVVVDDGSTDNSADIVKSYQDTRVKYVYKKNEGVSVARNYGVNVSSGEWIVFIDADDFFLDDALQILLDSVSLHNVECGAANFFVERSHCRKFFSPLKSGLIRFPFFLWYMDFFVPRTGAAIFKKDILKKMFFKPFLQRYEDAEMLLNVMREHVFYYDCRPIMVYTNDYSCLSHLSKDPEKDFVFHMNLYNKSFWEVVYLMKLLRMGAKGYPHKKMRLKSMYGIAYNFRFLEQVPSFLIRSVRKIYRVFV